MNVNLFVNANFSNLSINCNILKGNFFSDSFYYFPITENNETFSSLFTRDLNNISHFYSQKFFDNFKDNRNSLKNFKELYILGSNAGNNYYSNLLQFLPRIFFNKKTNLKLAIHRNSSNKYRNFITNILKSLNIEFTFVFLDDDFYYFIDSEFPQFLSMNDSIKILKKFINPKTNVEISKKIYVTREESSYRKILNEGDVITILREKGYKVINPQLYEIDEQIEIFSNAEKIIAPHGSNLANIIFCKPGTEIIEITPSFKDNEKILEDRYLNLSLINDLKHNKIVSDTVDVDNHSTLAKKYIHNNVLSQSNYYKNLIVKNEDTYVKESFDIPELVKTIIQCKESLVLNILNGLTSETVIKCLNAGDMNTAIKELTKGKLKVCGGWAVTQLLDALNRGVDAFIPTGMEGFYTKIYNQYQSGNEKFARELFYKFQANTAVSTCDEYSSHNPSLIFLDTSSRSSSGGRLNLN